MTDLNAQELFDLWKKGIKLNQALFHFTDSRLIQEYRNSLNPNNMQTEITKENLPSLSQVTLDGLNTLGKLYQSSQLTKDKLNNLKWNLLENILSEKIIGIAYKAPIKIEDQPKTIPLNFYPDEIKKINWENSSFIKHGIEFLEIRLIKSKNEASLFLPKTKPNVKKVGRPNSEKDLVAAYELLKKNNKIDFTLSLKAHEQMLCATVKMLRQSDDASGTNYKTISKYLSPLFKKDKNL